MDNLKKVTLEYRNQMIRNIFSPLPQLVSWEFQLFLS